MITFFFQYQLHTTLFFFAASSAFVNRVRSPPKLVELKAKH